MAETYRNYLQRNADSGGAAAQALLNMVGDDGKFGTTMWRDNNTGQIWSADGEAGAANAAMWERYNNVGPGATTDDGAGLGPSQYLAPQSLTQQQQADQAKANQDAATRNSVANGKANTVTGVNENADIYNRNQRNTILDWITTMGQQQEGINTKRANSQLGFDNASRSIMDMVGRGVKSAGTMLANRNASASSSGEAIAQAYNQLGQSKMSGAGNELAMANANTDVEQGAYNAARDSGKRKFGIDTQNQVDTLISGARNAFAALNDQLIGAGLEDRINIEQEKENLRQTVLQKLAGLDAEVNKVDNIQAASKEQTLAKAGELRRAGTDIGSQFNVGDITSQLTDGANPSQLPLYSFRNKRY